MGTRLVVVDDDYGYLIKVYSSRLKDESLKSEELLEVFAGKVNIRYLSADSLEPFFIFTGCILMAIGQYQQHIPARKTKGSTSDGTEPFGSGSP